MKTFKSMLSVVCCWCLCLSLCSVTLAKEVVTQEELLNTTLEQIDKLTPEQKIALQKQKDKEIYDAKIEALRLAKEQANYENTNSYDLESYDPSMDVMDVKPLAPTLDKDAEYNINKKRDAEGNPGKMQYDFLRNIYSGLKPNGRISSSEENICQSFTLNIFFLVAAQ